MTEKEKDSAPMEIAQSAVSALEKPTSVLLFAVVLIAVLVVGSWFETDQRVGFLSRWVTLIEQNRSKEIDECHTTLRQVLSNHMRARLGENVIRDQREQAAALILTSGALLR